MIPILYDKTEQDFTSNGLGGLADASSCVVTEERNGIFELEMAYPVTGVHFDDLKVDNYIKCKKDAAGSKQLFRIYKIRKPINGKCTILAEHVSYQMLHIPLMPFEAVGAQATFAAIPSHVVGDCPFTFETNLTSTRRFRLFYPKSLRGALQGDQWSILQNFSGDYEWDNFTVRLLSRRGADNGVIFRYGKNIRDLKQEENIQQTYTGIVPYWYGQTGDDPETVVLPEKVLYNSDTVGNFDYTRVLPVDLTYQFEEKPTVAELRTAGQQYISRNEIGYPAVSISLDMVDLSQTEEYAGRAFESMNLGDTVKVVFEELGISKEARITRTTYDVLTERYTNLYIGESYHSIASIIANQGAQINSAIYNTVNVVGTTVGSAVNAATAALTGQNGGHIYFGLGSDGEPNEIYIMDTTSVSTAQKVWRYNLAGWGVSTTGIAGPYTMAATIESGLVADFVTAGTMLADRIKGGTLELGGDNNVNGVMVVKDANGNTISTFNKDGAAISGTIRNDYSNGYYVDISNGRMSVGDADHGEAGYVDGSWYFDGTQYIPRLALRTSGGLVFDAEELYARQPGSVNMKGGSGSITVNGVTITFENGIMITDIA